MHGNNFTKMGVDSDEVTFVYYKMSYFVMKKLLASTYTLVYFNSNKEVWYEEDKWDNKSLESITFLIYYRLMFNPHKYSRIKEHL